MALLRKFPLSGHYFISVSLNGKLPEIRITKSGLPTFHLTAAELDVLHKESTSIRQKEIIISTTDSPFGGHAFRKCVPDMTNDGINFFTLHVPASQPDDGPIFPDYPLAETLDEFVFPEYSLGKATTLALVRLLPKIMESVQLIIDQEESISLAYEVVRVQIKRLYESQGGGVKSFEQFLTIMRILFLHVPISFLMDDFKSKSAGTMLNIRELMLSTMYQFEYIYANLY